MKITQKMKKENFCEENLIVFSSVFPKVQRIEGGKATYRKMNLNVEFIS